MLQRCVRCKKKSGSVTAEPLLAVKLVGRRAKSAVAACVYRSPGTVTSAFTEQLSNLFDQLVLLDSQFVVLGDFNAPGVTARQLDQRAIDVFTQHGLRQHVRTPTRGNLTSGNILDLVSSLDDQPNGQLVSDVTVQSVSFSDHHLVTCSLGVPPQPPVTTTYIYRPLRKVDVAAFSRDILSSRLYDSTVTDADDYAELFDVEVRRVLDIHAPLRTVRRRCGQHDIRQLSDEACQAKQLRRRLERRYRRTGLESDRRAYVSACSAARDSTCIMKSRADHIKTKLDEVSGDVGAMWRAAKNLLHNNRKDVFSDDECAKLVSTFCKFFVDKVNLIGSKS